MTELGDYREPSEIPSVAELMNDGLSRLEARRAQDAEMSAYRRRLHEASAVRANAAPGLGRTALSAEATGTTED